MNLFNFILVVYFLR